MARQSLEEGAPERTSGGKKACVGGARASWRFIWGSEQGALDALLLLCYCFATALLLLYY